MAVQPGLCDLVGNPEDRFSHNEAHLKTRLSSGSMWRQTACKLVMGILIFGPGELNVNERLSLLDFNVHMVHAGQVLGRCGFHLTFGLLSIRPKVVKRILKANTNILLQVLQQQFDSF